MGADLRSTTTGPSNGGLPSAVDSLHAGRSRPGADAQLKVRQTKRQAATCDRPAGRPHRHASVLTRNQIYSQLYQLKV